MTRKISEILNEDLLQDAADEGKTLALTCYFSSRPDPQAAIKAPAYQCRPDDLTYLSSWMATSSFVGMQPVTFVDTDNSEFVDVLVRKGCVVVRCVLGEMSTNDERFFLYKDFLERRGLRDDMNVVFTDCSDVLFKKDPGEFIEQTRKICLGADMTETPLVKTNLWAINKIENLVKERPSLFTKEEILGFIESPLVNAGVLGGKIANCLNYLEHLVGFLNLCPAEGNWNMVAFNYAHWRMRSDCFAGSPFVSGFKKYNYEFPGYIVHK